MCRDKNNKNNKNTDGYDYTDGFLVYDNDDNNNNNNIHKKNKKPVKKKIHTLATKTYNTRKSTIQFEKTNIEEIQSLQGIITLCTEYQTFLNTHHQKAKRILILDRLVLTIDSLIQLNNMIGLTSIKTTITKHYSVLYTQQ